MTDRYDAIVIGGGHNGLVCASILAKSGKSVLLLEAAPEVGGAAVTRTFAEGFSVSACAHLLYQLQPTVTKALDLEPDLAADDLATIVLAENGDHVRYTGGDVSGVPSADIERFAEFRRAMERYAGMLEPHLNRPPPRLGQRDRRQLFALARLGLDVRRLGKRDMREFLRIVAINIYDELNERFESERLRGGLAADATLGTHLGPRSPGTMLNYLYRLAGCAGRLSQPVGGMGRLSNKLAARAEALGVEVRTGQRVARVCVENGRAAGVETEDGERFDSLIIASSADPKTTVLELVGARHFEARFVHRVSNIRMSGNAAKLHVGLDGLPKIEGMSATDYGQRLLIAPSHDYVERAFNPAKYGELSPEPVVEITFPSVHDHELVATQGQHVMSAIVQYAPYALKGGWTDTARERLMATTVSTLSRYMPDLEERMLAHELLTPFDIERTFGMGGGHWHHGELALDQFFFVRPVAGAAAGYRGSLDGLFFCGAGTHPGGGVSGAAGRNAALAILDRERI